MIRIIIQAINLEGFSYVGDYLHNKESSQVHSLNLLSSF